MSFAIVAALLKRGLGFIFDDGRGKIMAISALGLGFVTWFAFENQTIGAESAKAQGRQANAQGHSIGSKGVRNANRPGAGSVLDPHTFNGTQP